MRALKNSAGFDFQPSRFARRFEQVVGLKLSHVLIAALALAAMYFATESYSGEAGYAAPRASASATQR